MWCVHVVCVGEGGMCVVWDVCLNSVCVGCSMCVQCVWYVCVWVCVVCVCGMLCG